MKYFLLFIFLITNINANNSMPVDSCFSKATLAPRTNFFSNSPLLESETLKNILVNRPNLAKELTPLLNELSKCNGNIELIDSVLKNHDLTGRSKNYTIFFNHYLPKILKETNIISDISDKGISALEDVMDTIQEKLEEKLNLIVLQNGVYNPMNKLHSDNAFIQWDINIINNSIFPSHLQDLFKLLILFRMSEKRDLQYSGESSKFKYISSQGENALKSPIVRRELINAERNIIDSYEEQLNKKEITVGQIREKVELAQSNIKEEARIKAMREAEREWNKANSQFNATEQLIDDIFSEFFKYFMDIQKDTGQERLKTILNYLRQLNNIKSNKNIDLDNAMVSKIISFAMFNHDKNGIVIKNDGNPVLRESFKVIGEKMRQTNYNILREMFRFNFVINRTTPGSDDLLTKLNSFNIAA